MSRLVNVLYRTELRRLLAQDALADMPQHEGTVERMNEILLNPGDKHADNTKYYVEIQ